MCIFILLLQIKSLDKKLRKLDAAMTYAKDDPSMLHAVNGYAANGYARWSEESEQVDWSGAESPTLCPSDVSNAATPRNYTIASRHGSGSLTPAAEAPFPSARPAKASSTKTVAANAHELASAPINVPAQPHGQVQGAPIKVEFPLPPAMLKQLADGNSNISFVVKGLDGTGELSAVDFRFAESSEPASNQKATASVVKVEALEETPDEAASQSSQGGMSDQDLIAMLADCAAKPAEASHDNFAEVLSERMCAVAQNHHSDSESSIECDDVAMQPGDEELMAALANCCGGQSPFESDSSNYSQNDDNSHNSVHGCTTEYDNSGGMLRRTMSESGPSSFSHEGFNAEDEMMALHSFSGGHGMALEDYLYA